MKTTIQIAYFISVIMIYVACNNKSNIDSKLNDSVSKPLVKEYNNQKETDTSFENTNYLRLGNLYFGPVFNDGTQKGHDVFYRIVEIPDEKELSLFVEKISTGSEGGNYELISRYNLDEKELGLGNKDLNRVDSVSFIDSVTVSGYFNHTKYKVDLNNRKAIKEGSVSK